MALLNKFISKNQIETQIDTFKTNEKFLYMKDEIVSLIIKTLKSLCELEEEYTLIEKKQGASFFELSWDDYKERYKAIIAPVCTEKLLKRGYADVLSSPATYAYLNTSKCKIDFIMKNEKKAVVETHFDNGIKQKHQITAINTPNGWKIDSFKYGYEDETTWNNYHI
ncbi:MAG: hypothetical protein ACK5MV_09155 [Aminipila sp.]